MTQSLLFYFWWLFSCLRRLPMQRFASWPISYSFTRRGTHFVRKLTCAICLRLLIFSCMHVPSTRQQMSWSWFRAQQGYSKRYSNVNFPNKGSIFNESYDPACFCPDRYEILWGIESIPVQSETAVRSSVKDRCSLCWEMWNSTAWWRPFEALSDCSRRVSVRSFVNMQCNGETWPIL